MLGYHIGPSLMETTARVPKGVRGFQVFPGFGL